MFAIVDTDTKELLAETISSDEEEAWNKYLGFRASDDQWYYQQQKSREAGMKCVRICYQIDPEPLQEELASLKREWGRTKAGDSYLCEYFKRNVDQIKNLLNEE
jgi:hypothetical protein